MGLVHVVDPARLVSVLVAYLDPISDLLTARRRGPGQFAVDSYPPFMKMLCVCQNIAGSFYDLYNVGVSFCYGAAARFCITMLGLVFVYTLYYSILLGQV